MTVSSQTSRIEQLGDGTTTAFAVSFYFLADADLKVFVDGVQQTIVTNYTVTGASNPAGGSVTFVSAPANGVEVVIFRDPAITQGLDYIDNDPFPAESHERGLDKLTMIAQRVKDLVSRALRLGDSVVGVSTELPALSGGQLLGTNPGGTGFQLYPLGQTPQDAGSTVYTPPGTGAVATTVEQKIQEGGISPEDFMTQSDRTANYLDPGSVNVTYAFTAAKTEAVLKGKALVLSGEGYLIDAGFNFAANNFQVIGVGQPFLQFSGSGRGFVLDTGGADGNVLHSMIVCNLLLKGSSTITDLFYCRGIVRSDFENIQGQDCTGVVFWIRHAVSNRYANLKYSTNDFTQIANPSIGLKVDNNGVGYYTANTTFINPVCEGFTGKGCEISDASGNVFLGGTFEGMTGIGLDIASDECRRNHFISLWCEANTTNDIRVKGVDNQFTSVYTSSASSGPTIDVSTGKGTVFTGGFLRQVNLQSTSQGTVFTGSSFSDNTALGITGTGTYKSVACKLVDTNLNVTGYIDDVVGDSDTWTPNVTQDVGVSVTIDQAKIRRTGRVVNLRAKLTVTSGGTLGSAVIIGGIPTEYAANSSQTSNSVGVATIRLGGTFYVLSCRFQSTSQLSFINDGATSLFGISPSVALSANDLIEFTINYEI